MPIAGPAAGFVLSHFVRRAIRELAPDVPDWMVKLAGSVAHAVGGYVVAALLAPVTLGTDFASTTLTAALEPFLPAELIDGIIEKLPELLATLAGPTGDDGRFLITG